MLCTYPRVLHLTDRQFYILYIHIYPRIYSNLTLRLQLRLPTQQSCIATLLWLVISLADRSTTLYQCKAARDVPGREFWENRNSTPGPGGLPSPGQYGAPARWDILQLRCHVTVDGLQQSARMFLLQVPTYVVRRYKMVLQKGWDASVCKYVNNSLTARIAFFLWGVRTSRDFLLDWLGRLF